MRTFVQVLILELDETDGDPTHWNRTSIVDTIGIVGVVRTVEVEPYPTDEQVDMLARLSTDYRDAVQREIGVVE